MVLSPNLIPILWPFINLKELRQSTQKNGNYVGEGGAEEE
jgi:hypothetical protein